MEDSVRLRQVIFKLDKNKIYKFNTNSTVTIKSLRKIIIAAANITNKNLVMLNQDKDYNEFENFTIQQLFPVEKTIEFIVKILPDVETPVPIKLRQGVNCLNHKYKFPYFYCYDCKYSICSLCVQSKEHLNHKLLDKHDYVQNTDVIVDTLFNDFKGLLTELSIDKEAEIEQYKEKIDKEIFPYLFSQLNDVKNKVFKIMNLFIESINKNKKILFENVEHLKTHSYDGIEDLKKRLNIEDIMVDEEIFLAFDEKMKEISTEKMRILRDSKKYEDLLKIINFLSSNIDNIYEEIVEIIDKKLKSNIQEKLSEKLLENNITSITRDEIDSILFSDLKKPRRPKIEPPQPKKADFLSGLFSNKNYGVTGNLTNFFSTLQKENIKPVSGQHSMVTSPVKEIKDIELQKEQPKEKIREQPNEIIREQPKEQPQQIEQSKEQLNEQSSVTVNKIKNPEDTMYYCKPNTKCLIVYNDINEEIFELDVNANDIVNFKEFLPGCSWVNNKGVLYITGGISGEETSNQAFLFDGSKNRLLALPNMINRRGNHSSIRYNDKIFVTGGKFNSTIEYFDTRRYKWSVLGNMIIEREFPSVYVYKDYLYTFFGMKNSNPTDTVERISILGNAKSELVKYGKEGVFDLSIYGAGIIEMTESILILGGKYKDSFNRNNIFQFEFLENKFDSFEFDIESDVIFVESTLHKLKDGHYSNFNKNDSNLFKIVIDS